MPHCPHQPQRMMYWPSTSTDGAYVFDYLDAPFLDPDEVLATYHNWADVSSWPMSSRVAEIARRRASKQQDPLEKSGIVGAFCRAYTIQEAISEFIPEYQAIGRRVAETLGIDKFDDTSYRPASLSPTRLAQRIRRQPIPPQRTSTRAHSGIRRRSGGGAYHHRLCNRNSR